MEMGSVFRRGCVRALFCGYSTSSNYIEGRFLFISRAVKPLPSGIGKNPVLSEPENRLLLGRHFSG